MRKKIALSFLMLALIITQLFAVVAEAGNKTGAESANTGTYTIKAGQDTVEFSGFKNILKLAFTAIVPSVVALIFICRIVAAYFHSAQDFSAIKKAVVQIIVVIGIYALWIFGIRALFTFSNGSDASGFLASLSAAKASFLPPV